MMMQVGDVVPWDPRPSLFLPGEPRWHALQCAPLREEKATAHLRQHGVTAFFVVKEKHVTVRGKPMVRKQHFLPGYVFAKFPGVPVWHRVMDPENPARLIRGVLRLSSGEPGRLRVEDLRTLRELADRDEEREEAERARSLAKVGDVVRIEAFGATGEVVEITAWGGKRVRFMLFGAEREIILEGDVAIAS